MNDALTEYLRAALLAVIQGAAELLPVSSSAHVIFAEHLMGIDSSSPRATFLLVMLHTGTMGAVLVYFWPRWKGLLVDPKSGGSALTARRFIGLVILATAVTIAVGYGLQQLIERVVLERMLGRPEGEVEQLFKELPLVAAALFTVGVVIVAASFFESRAVSPVLTPWSAVLIGLVQALALPFRGFSRSGATISTGLFCGVARPLAEDFSFALAVVLTPPVIARGLYRLWKSGNLSAGELLPLVGPGLAGMVLSFLAGLVALRVLSAALERGRWRYFGFYCLAAALVFGCYAYVTRS
jgi:undecaprenyl-diphosphatase